MGLPWVRLDTQFPSNPKVLELAAGGRWRSLFVYVTSLAYAGAHGTDGYIPESALVFIHATRGNANDLVKCRLWTEDIGGWHVNDWDEYQVSDEAAQKRRERAQKGAAARWNKVHTDASQAVLPSIASSSAPSNAHKQSSKA
jgi:hypothetical protein